MPLLRRFIFRLKRSINWFIWTWGDMDICHSYLEMLIIRKLTLMEKFFRYTSRIENAQEYKFLYNKKSYEKATEFLYSELKENSSKWWD